MLDLVLLGAAIGLIAVTLFYGAACEMLMRADSTRDQNVEA